MKTRLIIVEGLPGSGKSTMAARLAEELRRAGRRVVCADEGEPGHPADFAVYDFPDFETERREILGKWRNFVETASLDTLYVFNCVLLQNPMTETMMRFDMTEAESAGYIAEIAEIIRPLRPAVLYIDLPDPKGAVDAVLDERGTGWLNAVAAYHTGQGYGKRNRLTGYAGYLKCLEERKVRELNILRTLDVDWRVIGRDADIKDLARAAVPAICDN